MAAPQSGILPPGNSHALFVTLLLNAGRSAMAQAGAACRAVPRLTRELAATCPEAQLGSVVGIAAQAWERLFTGPRPRHLHPFVAQHEGERHAPATPVDVLLHIRSERADVNYLLAKAVMSAFGKSVVVAEDIAGFRYLDNRDLTGFVDGTANPQGEERAAVALVADDPPFAGGSYVHLQRYVHNLAAWEQLPVAQQESVIGRTKAGDVELDDDSKPPTAHIARVEIEEQGEELELLRHSMPYGGAREAGLVFVAYGRSPHAFETMLARMIHADAAGHYDHLMRYTRAVTGALCFAPPLDFLDG
ncbi:MAG: Dyp-type peroxidase [Candidatus Lambdaproteobacteria bacterium]|nr:Dyp-type peroxidase [Candidatus Lambdaproteobacteria bacterium]